MLERVGDVVGGQIATARQYPPVVAAEAAYDTLWGTPKAGMAQMGQGATELAMAGGDLKQMAVAVSDLAEGAMKVGSPLILPAFVAAPYTTPIMMSLATVASEEVGKYGEKRGWPQEYVRLAQNAATLAVLGGRESSDCEGHWGDRCGSGQAGAVDWRVLPGEGGSEGSGVGGEHAD
jgi:hypothetical protein